MTSAGISALENAKLLQAQAADTSVPVWVGASAGSGKTTVLITRLLRLMMPYPGRPAADPSRILCITYTKAAAAEIIARLLARVRDWAVMGDDARRTSIAEILGEAPTPQQMEKAASLFAELLEVPGGLRIMTIHSFCQSVLGRFPLEAGLPPGFSALEEAQSASLMQQARHSLIADLQKPGYNPRLKEAFDFLAAHKSAEDIEKLAQALASKRSTILKILETHKGIDGLEQVIHDYLNPQKLTLEQAHQTLLSQIRALDIGYLAAVVPQTTEMGQILYTGISRLLAYGGGNPAEAAENIYATFVTKTHKPRAPKLAAIKNDPKALGVFTAAQDFCMAYIDTLNALETIRSTQALMRFGAAMMEKYEAAKKHMNAVDFDDQIALTARLLQDNRAAWVLYRLDGGIDHILLDEAQDTSPIQWDIIDTLRTEMTADTAALTLRPRTSFVVGDEKQSIYSFQGADPRAFGTMKGAFTSAWQLVGTSMRDVPMRTSFRSAPAVLNFVDQVFSSPDTRRHVMMAPDQPMVHHARYTGRAGKVEVWPLTILDKDVPGDNPRDRLCTQIAQQIKKWLDTGTRLLAHDRPIDPGDIMILLRRRQGFAEPVLRALRAEGLPVNGLDRMVLTDQLVVQDILALLRFYLQPLDDLSLACVLKGPLVGMDETALMHLAAPRPKGTTLWQALQGAAQHRGITQWLQTGRDRALTQDISSVLHSILYSPCPGDDLSGLRALCRALGNDCQDPLFEVLAMADRFVMRELGGLQLFVKMLAADASDIKREGAGAGGVIRVMTVHGSKGMEAPIVFLPDTTGLPEIKLPLSWPDGPDELVPLWSAKAKPYHPSVLKQRLDAHKDLGMGEYRRLLYVALTRAEQHVIICGSHKSNALKPESWYGLASAAMARLGHAVTDPVTGITSVSSPQTDPLIPARAAPKPLIDTPQDIPSWALMPAPALAVPPRPLMPSRMQDADIPALSPLAGLGANRFKRGQIIHTLFQYMPQHPPALWAKLGPAYLARPVLGLSDAAQQEIWDRVWSVLTTPDYAPLFGPGSRAEVPVTGLVGSTPVSGQIDRLLITPTQVHIVDFKTNRPAAANPHSVATGYKRQLSLYKALLQAMYPQRAVSCYLLWTDGPDLMDMTDHLDTP